jgi:hypothetical protein
MEQGAVLSSWSTLVARVNGDRLVESDEWARKAGAGQ